MDMGASIRVADPDRDGPALARIYAPYVSETVISFEEQPPTAEAMAERSRLLLPSHPYLVCERDREVIGFAYAGEHKSRAAYRWSVDVSVYVDRARHRRGVGRALYGRLLEIVARQGFHQAFAGITLPNAASVGLHEAMGFCFVGAFAEVGYKFGAWRDVGWWRRPLGPREAPAEPIRFAQMRATDADGRLIRT